MSSRSSVGVANNVAGIRRRGRRVTVTLQPSEQFELRGARAARRYPIAELRESDAAFACARAMCSAPAV